MVSFAVQKLLSLIKFYFLFLLFITSALGDRYKKNVLLQFMSKSVLPMFSSRSFMYAQLLPWTVACHAPLSMGFSRQ